MFLHYVKHSRQVEPAFSEFTNALTIGDYGKFLSDVRDLKSVTIARHIYAVRERLDVCSAKQVGHREGRITGNERSEKFTQTVR